MGWFLFRKRSKAPSKAKAAEKWDRARTLRGVKWLLSAIVLAALVYGWQRGEHHLQAFVSARGQVVTGDQVTLAGCPTWLHGDVQRDLRWLVASQVAADPMDATGLEAARRLLAGNPWVEGVDRISRQGRGITVEARFRRPVALVMIPRPRRDREDYLRPTDEFCLVDSGGVRLASDSLGRSDLPYKAEHIKKLGLPVIVGVAKAPPPAGQRWEGADLRAGLSLAKMLSGEEYAGQIVAYDVAGRDTRQRLWLALRTKSGLVWWGLPPGQEHSVEYEAAVKKRWLAGVYAKYGRSIDAGGKVVSLYGPAPIVHQKEETQLTVAAPPAATAGDSSRRRTAVTPPGRTH